MKLLLLILCLLPWLLNANVIAPDQVGAEQTERYFPMLKNKRIGLVVNQTSRAKGQHLVDLLVANQFDVQMIFAPEHGFRGDQDAGAKISSGRDGKTGIRIESIYGKSKKPSKDKLQQLDIILFDIQDVGVRFYTYISSMFYMMQAAAESDIPFVVLDRPNPNIAFVDGPLLEPEFRSFVGLLPVPLLHGMTVGELAQMIQGEGWLDTIANVEGIKHQLQLSVIPVESYHRQQQYQLPVLPSPNLPNHRSIMLYPSLCFFEATPISIGRGTDFPFQVVGHHQHAIGSFEFSPRSIQGAASNPKLKGLLVTGQDLRQSEINGLDLSIFYQWYQLFASKDAEFFQRADFMDKLAGTDQIRKDMLAGKTLKQISSRWQKDLAVFKKRRLPYLLYPETNEKNK